MTPTKQPSERTPLLANLDEDEQRVSSPSRAPSAIARFLLFEAAHIFRHSLPTSLGYMLQNSIQTVSVTIVSLNGSDTELSAAAHGFMIAMVTAWTLALGGTTAMDTLASVAYSRSLSPDLPKQAALHTRHQVGLLLQRGLVILTCLFVPVAFLWFFCEPVLLALSQPPLVAAKVQTFLRFLIPGAPGYIAFESLKKYVQVQGDSRTPTLVLALTFPLNLALNFLFIRVLGLGLLGSPLAVSITYYASALLLLLHVRTFGRGTTLQAWGGWDLKRAMDHKATWVYAKLAVNGWIMVASEWVAFEVVALVAGSLGEVELAAQSVIMTADQLINTLPFGLGVASSSRIAHLLGTAAATRTTAEIDGGDPSTPSSSSTPPSKPPTPGGPLRVLALSAQSAFVLSTVQGFLIALPLFLSRFHFGALFSDSPEVIAAVGAVIPLVALFQISDGWAQSQGGVLRGMGRQEVGAAANLVAYYIMALPLGVYLAKYASPTPWGLPGLWVGQCLALSLVGAGEYAAVCLTDWREQVRLALSRGDEGEGEGAGGGNGNGVVASAEP